VIVAKPCFFTDKTKGVIEPLANVTTAPYFYFLELNGQAKHLKS